MLNTMDCQHVRLEPGDVLYLPKGAAHYAHTGEAGGSLHATISIDRVGHTWADYAIAACHSVHGQTLELCAEIEKALAHLPLLPATLRWLELAGDARFGWDEPFSPHTNSAMIRTLEELLLASGTTTPLSRLIRNEPYVAMLTKLQLSAMVPTDEALLQVPVSGVGTSLARYVLGSLTQRCIHLSVIVLLGLTCCITSCRECAATAMRVAHHAS